jgi:glycerophosphoryl diester phosphodiesterase
MLTLKEYVLTNRVCVAAHRGASGTAPENTMAAFREAIESGVGMIEIDVQFTADGKAIVYHDATLQRTSNSYGKLDDLSYDKIRELDAGSWFDSKFSGERIPLLIEVLEFVKGQVYLSIEIKARKPDENLPANLSKLVRVIDEYNLIDYIVFASFNYSVLKILKDINPAVHIAAIKIPGNDTLPSLIARDIGIEAFICSVDELSELIAEDAASCNVFLGVYNADTPAEIIKALDYKVWAIGTNYPQMAINEIEKY